MAQASAPRAMALATSAELRMLAGGHDGGPVADALVAQALVDGGDGDLEGDAHVVADDRRGGSRAAPETV